MSGIFSAIQIASQGLSVQRAKMNIAAKNLANVETTETPEGGPYRRERVIVKEDKTKTSFSTMMKKAGASLRRTNPRHFQGASLSVRNGVEVPAVTSSETVAPPDSYRLVYDPTHPDADEEGYVKMPDIEIVDEMVDMMAASRAYEANTIAISSAKEMAKNALDI